MSHVRTQIRNQLVTYLTGLSTTGSNVFKSRPQARPLQSSELPGLVIYTEGEDDAPQTMGGPSSMQLERHLRVKIEAIVRVNSAFDDTLDTIINEVETALNASVTTFSVNNLARLGIRLTSIDDPEFDGQGDKVVGRVAMTWTAIYRTVASTPGTAI